MFFVCVFWVGLALPFLCSLVGPGQPQNPKRKTPELRVGSWPGPNPKGEGQTRPKEERKGEGGPDPECEDGESCEHYFFFFIMTVNLSKLELCGARGHPKFLKIAFEI